MGGKKSLMNADRVRALESIGFPWMRKISKWDEMYQKLCSHKNRYGTVEIRRQNSSISEWLHNQRRRHNRRDTGALTSEQVHLLNELGVDLEIEAEKKEGTQKIQKGFESMTNMTPIQTTAAKASGEMVRSGGGTKFYSGIPLKHMPLPRSLAVAAVPDTVSSNRKSPDAVASVTKVSFDNELSRSETNKKDSCSRDDEKFPDDKVHEDDGYCSSDSEASLVF